MDERSKKKYQHAADLAATYGVAVLGRIDHAMLCGLAFNSSRAEIRKANRVRMAIGAAFSKRLDEAWFSSMSDSQDEADSLRNRYLATISIAESEA